MQTQILNSLKKSLLAAAALACVHCGQSPAALTGKDGRDSAFSGSTDAVVKSTVVLGKVGALRKASTINLKRLYLVAISSSTPADTVLDSSSISGNDAVTVTRALTLKPLRNWTLAAMTKDMKDSIIHMGSTTSFFVKPADTVAVSLNLTSRYSMYQADFNSLPDSISSALPGTGKDKLNLNRLVLKVDGQIQADSSAAGSFGAGQSVNVYFDYITPGTHTVTLEAYGTLHTYSGILYSGSSSFSVAAGVDDTRAVTLNWVGPTTGTGKITVVLGRIGKVVINGGISGAIL